VGFATHLLAMSMNSEQDPTVGAGTETATVDPGSANVPLLELVGITKEFPGCLANDQVDLAIYPGKIHALLGQNGAGKSTLVNIIYGVLQATSGSILWQGKPVRINSPAVARSMGIAMVFQHFSLFDSLTVLDNISLSLGADSPEDSTGESLAQRISRVTERYGLPLEPDRYVYTLSVGERQRIEIIRCLLQQPKILIMDEPTSVLTPQEIDNLFATLSRLASEGVAIVYISHKLEEIKRLCDSATILRDGRCVASADPSQESASSLAGLMIGDTLETTERVTDKTYGEVMLKAVQLSSASHHHLDSSTTSVNGIDFELRSGEILGVAGVAGNGQDELLGLLAGEVTARESTMLTLRGEAIGSLSAGARRLNGLCCVPEERLGHAAVPGMTLADNAFLTGHHRLDFSRGGFLRTHSVDEFANRIIDRFQVAANNARMPASSLSGGNLQKFVVGREILQQPDVLVVAQPTWGVDAGAATSIHQAILDLAGNGSAVLIISQDLDELMLLCDSLFALCAGKGSATYPVSELDVQQIGLLMAGMTLEGHAQ